MQPETARFQRANAFLRKDKAYVDLLLWKLEKPKELESPGLFETSIPVNLVVSICSDSGKRDSLNHRWAVPQNAEAIGVHPAEG